MNPHPVPHNETVGNHHTSQFVFRLAYTALSVSVASRNRTCIFLANYKNSQKLLLYI